MTYLCDDNGQLSLTSLSFTTCKGDGKTPLGTCGVPDGASIHIPFGLKCAVL